MNDERTDFEIALDDLLQVARHAPRTGEGYQEIQAARRAFLAAFPPPAPGEVTRGEEVAVALTRDDLALVAYGLRSATRSEQNIATFSALRRLADTFALAAHAAAPEQS